MSGYLSRLRTGERWWVAELVLRGFGVMLLYGTGRLALVAQRLIAMPPPHEASPAEFGLGMIVFAVLVAGLAFTSMGGGVFRTVPIPAHSAYF